MKKSDRKVRRILDKIFKYMYYKYMKYCKLFLSFLIVIFFTGCGNASKIVNKDFIYEKIISETHRLSFNIHLENIGNSGKKYNLINNLIYNNKNFDEYMEYKEENFFANLNKEDNLPVIDDDGDFYLYSELIENYSIIFNNNAYIIFEYNFYAIYSGMAHGNSLTRYFIIDLKEERILDINDLINPIPDDLLKEAIEIKYDLNNFFRGNIWPPDTVNFYNNSIELIWDAYTLAAYSYGMIRIEIQNETVEKYLTDKGKTLKKITAGRK